MIKKGKLALPLALILALALVVPVTAQEGETPPCEGEGVSGTVVAVNEETGEVTLDTGEVTPDTGEDPSLCTVTLDGEYDHPIVDLLGSYFGDVNADDLTAALEATKSCAVADLTGAWSWSDCDEDDAVEVTVVAENEGGTFTILVDGVEVTVSVDGETPEGLTEALQALSVDWNLDGDGGFVHDIAAYHDDGLGFGVLVKLYAMAAALEETCADADAEEPCGATVDELVAAFQSGMGLGDLMEEYGKPTILGIGHIKGKDRGKPERAGPKDREDQPDDEDDDGLQPEHAGPKDKPTPPGQAKDKNGPPGHANAKPKKSKKDK